MGELLNAIMPITKSDVDQVRAVYGKSEESIKEDIEIIKRWMEQQPHLPKHHDEVRIERFLLRNKFRIKSTKDKLENYYTLRGIHSDYFSNTDPESIAMQNARKCMLYVLFPKLSPELERISLCSLTGSEHLYKLEDCVLYILAIMDLELCHDYPTGMRIIFDLERYTMEHLKQFNIAKCSFADKLHHDAFSTRVAGVEIINPPPFFATILNILKLVGKQRLLDKIRIHEDVESLRKCIPKECLPVEYGGDTFSIHKIHEATGKLLLEKRLFILDQLKKVSNEDLRIGEVNENQQFGVDGSFRKINLD